MLSTISVKKPYTVVVGVVLVIILGIVSFMHMTTDLLPDMNLPYAIVYTTYAGASPEEVETVVTRPVEQAMATISNIENVQSVSSENISMVVLEFAQTANMDSATIEMRESLDQIEGYWDDSVGSPVIMKLNPDMMPVMVAAVEAGSMTSAELSDFVSDNITPELESIEGVASVTTTGTVEEQVQVLIRQEKIDALNERIVDALDGKFEDAEAEIADAEAEIADGKEALESGQNQLQDGTASAESQINSGQSEILKNELQLEEKLTEVNKNLSELETQEAELDAQEKQLEEAQAQLDALPGQMQEASDAKSQLETAIVSLDALPEQLDQVYTGQDASMNLSDVIAASTAALQQAVDGLQTAIEASEDENEKAVLQEQLDAAIQTQTNAVTGFATLQGALTGMGISQDQNLSDIKQAIENKKTEMIAQKVQLEGSISTLQTAIDGSAENQTQITAGKQAISEGRTKITEGKKQLQSAKTQLEGAKSQIASGKITLAAALAQLNASKISATIEIAANKAKLDMGETQLNSSKEELENQKDAAYEKADANTIVTADMVKGLLTAENFSMPAGYVTEKGIDYLVRVGDKYDTTEGMQDMELMDMHIDGLAPIRLSDVADVVVTDNSADIYAKINGNPGIMFTMEKQSGYSTGDVSKKIKEKFTQLESTLNDIHMVTLMDQGIYIDMVVSSVLSNMLYGAVLAILILFLFLRSLRPTIVIAFSIPISIVTALVLMYFSGISLNIISLSGLALGVGMLVDNSIVVIENIYRLRNEGVPARRAAMEGAKQVAGAITASTLTTVCVFAPIVFTDGITRQLFVDMGLTIAYSLLASLLIALTLVPMMGAGLLKNTKEKQSRLFTALQNAYAAVLAKALKYKVVVLFLALLFLGGSAALSISKGTAFMADMDSTQMSITLKAAKDASLADTAEVTDQALELIRQVDGVTDVGAMNGGSTMSMLSGGTGSSRNETSIYVLLDENKKLTNEEIAKQIEEKSKNLDCELDISTSTMDMSALGGSGISIKIKGRDLDKLKEMAGDIAEMVKNTEGTVDVSDGIEEKTAELRLIVNKDAAMKYNLTTAQVYQFLQKKLAEAKSATTLTTDTKDYEVMVLSDKDETLTRKKIKKLKIDGTDKDGKTVKVKLKNIVSFEDAEGFTSINRESQTRYVNVTAAVDEEHNIGLVSNALQKKLDSYEVPEGYSIEMAGEDETINDAIQQVLLMLVLAVAFMYLIMVAQFQSLLSPFIIMFTIPLAFTGGFLGLYLTDNPVSVIALIGFVMLSGIIVNNGIVLVDYTNQLRLDGMEKKKALVEAGRTRLRPVIMTALTTILGLITMALGTGMGAEMVQPMAIVTIGGLIYGTLLTLFVVPCIYDVLNRKKMRKFED